MNSKPLVWILYPDTPLGERTELTIFKEQWTELSWWMQLWSWLFFWWNKKNINHKKVECISSIVQQKQIAELQRLLGGDVDCRGVRLSPSGISDALHSLAPKSRMHVISLSTIPSTVEERQVDNLVTIVRARGHTVQSLEHPTQTNEWSVMIATLLRYNWIKSDSLHKSKRQIVFFHERTIQHWKTLSPDLEKPTYLLCSNLQKEFPDCEVHILHNSPSALSIIESLSTSDDIWYSFLNDVCSSEREIHPSLQSISNLQRLEGLDVHPEWMRFLLENIWDQTGTRS